MKPKTLIPIIVKDGKKQFSYIYTKEINVMEDGNSSQLNARYPCGILQ